MGSGNRHTAGESVIAGRALAEFKCAEYSEHLGSNMVPEIVRRAAGHVAHKEHWMFRSSGIHVEKS